jgi:hypothetical protein
MPIPAEAISSPNPPSQHRDPLILTLALLLVHVPLLLNDGFYADDWLMFRLAPDYPVNTDFLIHGAGHPFLFTYVTLANLSGHPAAFMTLLAMSAIVIGALNLRSLLLRLRVFSDFEAGLFAFLVFSYAGYQNWATKLLAAYLFSFALLCLGLNLLSILAEAGRRRIRIRVAALVTIFCSFSLNSMMVAYAIGLFAIVFVQGRGGASLLSRIAGAIRNFPDFIALPIVYWIAINHFFPKTGPYKAYYMPRLPGIDDLAGGLNTFWIFGFRKVIRQGLELMRDSQLVPALALLIAVALVAMLVRNRSLRAAVSGHSAVAIIWPVLAAAIVFVMCAMPYLASGVQPSEHFFDSRHLVLFGVPNALLLVAFLRVVGLLAIPRLIGFGLVAVVMAVGISALWSGYVNQQARWLRLEALMDDLRRSYREPPASVFALSDGFLDNPKHIFFGTPELTGALHLVWGPRPLLGFTGSHEQPTVLQEIDHASRMEGSAFRNFDPWGPQATIAFVPTTPVLDNYGLARSYYSCLLTACDAAALIDRIATVDIKTGPIANLAPRVPPKE